MEHSKVKESINTVIGNDSWMTPVLARKLASKQKQKKKRFVVMPAIATLVFTACTLVLLLLPHQGQTVQSVNTTSIYQHIENKELAKSVIQYFEAIQMEDRTAINAIFPSESFSNTDLLLKKYQHVNFSTMEVLNIAPLELEEASSNISIYVTYEQDNQTMMNKIQAQYANNQWTISENPASKSVAYEPFSPPEKLTFNYKIADTLPKDNSYALKEAYWTKPYLDFSYHFYEQGELLDVVIQKEENYYFLATMEKFKTLTSGKYPYEMVEYQNGDRNTSFYSFSAKGQESVYFYFNEQLNTYQAIKGEPGADSYAVNFDNDGNEEIFIIVHNRNPIVATLEAGNLFVTTPENNIEQPWDDSFVSFLFGGTVISLHYKDVNGQKNANYLWETKNEAKYVNDEKWN